MSEAVFQLCRILRRAKITASFGHSSAKKLSAQGAKATWPLTRGPALDSHYRGYVPFSSYGSAALGCTHYWHTSEVINKFRLHRWQWPSADRNECYNKWKCHWILSVYLCGI